MGYYIIVTNTAKTESCYFEGLRNSIPKMYKDRLVIKVLKDDTVNLIEKCQEEFAYDPQYRKMWIVFDRDQVKDFDQIIEDADRNGFNVGWSNPCIEIWLYAYFDKMPNIEESWTCVSKFKEIYQKKTGVKYSKSDRDLYRRLCENGDEEKAIKYAESKYKQCIREGKKIPSEMCPATTVYLLVEEIQSKISDDN